jgi:fructose-bisphosphate aldolase class 1
VAIRWPLREVTEEVLREVFAQLNAQGVLLEGMLLKPNMVLPGQGSQVQDSVEAVADATVACLLRTVPAAVAGRGVFVGRAVGAAGVGAPGRDET